LRRIIALLVSESYCV